MFYRQFIEKKGLSSCLSTAYFSFFFFITLWFLNRKRLCAAFCLLLNFCSVYDFRCCLKRCYVSCEETSCLQIGAKLEAVDMCEPMMISPATVYAHKGRLLQIRYDGWDDSFNQLFDFRLVLCGCIFYCGSLLCTSITITSWGIISTTSRLIQKQLQIFV